MSKFKFSYFPSFVDKGCDVDLFDVLFAIKDGSFRARVEALRSLKGDEEKCRELKKQLPHFTASLFGEARRIEHLVEYNPVIVLDIDHIGFEKAKRLRDGLFLFSHVLAAFISPGGEGLKILVLADSRVETHEQVFNEVSDFYEKFLGVPIDRSGKDVTRCTFISWYGVFYINEIATDFKPVYLREKCSVGQP